MNISLFDDIVVYMVTNDRVISKSLSCIEYFSVSKKNNTYFLSNKKQFEFYTASKKEEIVCFGHCITSYSTDESFCFIGQIIIPGVLEANDKIVFLENKLILSFTEIK